MTQTDQTPGPPPKRVRPWPLVLAVLLGAGAGVGWLVFTQPRVSPEPQGVLADAGVPTVDAGPTLFVDEGDALLKKLAAGWSSDPLFSRWLDALSLRHLVAAAQLVAEGSSPRPALPFLSITGPFAVREEEAAKPKTRPKKRAPPPPPVRVFIAPESYARYDGLAKAVGSVNAAAAGDAYAQLRPFCDAAFVEIGRPGARFDDVLAAALRRLSSVQVPEGEVELVPKGALYAFKDPSLEALSAAEKHVLRMGPKNARVLQDQLRAFASHAKLSAGR